MSTINVDKSIFSAITYQDRQIRRRKEISERFRRQLYKSHFSIIDRNYAYNQIKFSGWLSKNRQVMACIIGTYHEGDMVYVVDKA